MNRKKTGTGPDCNRWQPDLRLRFIRPENFTGCGSSKSGKRVNRHRAGWDRSQPVFTATTSHDHSTTPTSTTTTKCELRPPFRYPFRLQRRRHHCLGPASTATASKTTPARSPTTTTINTASTITDHSCTHNTSATTAMTKTMILRRRHFDNLNGDTLGDTSTAAALAATSTSRRRRRSAATTTRRQPRRRHIDNCKINTSTTTTAATTTRRQPRPTTPTRDNGDNSRNVDTSTTTGTTTTTTRRRRDGYHDAFTRLQSVFGRLQPTLDELV
ncbi:hypothetical protein EDB83DRAFT_2326819 [Lactarius deliciosus]|nr:hypothetical protein EDB83DRAFT_2326819 [Lactarius deliciosus]